MAVSIANYTEYEVSGADFSFPHNHNGRLLVVGFCTLSNHYWYQMWVLSAAFDGDALAVAAHAQQRSGASVDKPVYGGIWYLNTSKEGIFTVTGDVQDQANLGNGVAWALSMEGEDSEVLGNTVAAKGDPGPATVDLTGQESGNMMLWLASNKSATAEPTGSPAALTKIEDSGANQWLHRNTLKGVQTYTTQAGAEAVFIGVEILPSLVSRSLAVMVG